MYSPVKSKRIDYVFLYIFYYNWVQTGQVEKEFVSSEDNRSSPPKRPDLSSARPPGGLGELILTDLKGVPRVFVVGASRQRGSVTMGG